MIIRNSHIVLEWMESFDSTEENCLRIIYSPFISGHCG